MRDHYPLLERGREHTHRFGNGLADGALQKLLREILPPTITFGYSSSARREEPWRSDRVRFDVLDEGDRRVYPLHRTSRAPWTVPTILHHAYSIATCASHAAYSGRLEAEKLVSEHHGSMNGWIVQGADVGSIWVIERVEEWQRERGQGTPGRVPIIVVPRMFPEGSPEAGQLSVARDALLERASVQPIAWCSREVTESWNRASRMMQEVAPATWPIHATLCLMEVASQLRALGPAPV